MALISYTNIEDGQEASANDINQRFGDVLAQVNGSLDATNIKNGSLTRQLFATDALSAMWPVGSIYTSVSNVNPSSRLGGTWVEFAQGRTLIGVDTSQTEFNSVEKPGGEKTHTLTTGQMPVHGFSWSHHGDENGSVVRGAGAVGGSYTGGSHSQYKAPPGSSSGAGSNRQLSWSFGNNEAHNNLQPYITVYFWKRIS